MKRSIYFALILFYIFLSTVSFGSHFAGADISYRHIGGNQYQITLNYYRDCCGISMPSSVQMQAVNTCTNTNSNFILQDVSGTNNEMSQVCNLSGVLTTCQPSGVCPANPAGSTPVYPGIRLYVYTGTVTLNGNCNNWQIRFSECCRNNALSNIPNPSSTGYGLVAQINNAIQPATGIALQNSSIRFLEPGFHTACANSHIVFFHGGYNPDGDSLVYELVHPLNETYNPIPFNNGWSAQQPIKGTQQSFDTQTGLWKITPSNLEYSVAAIKVSEYRNGVLVGSVMRDIQIAVLPCKLTLPDITSAQNINSGYAGGADTLYACPSDTVQFQSLVLSEIGAPLKVSSVIADSAFVVDLLQQGTHSSVTAQVTYVVAPTLSGCHSFWLKSKLDNCPITGSNWRKFTLCTAPHPNIQAVSTSFCGTPVILKAVGGSNPVWAPNTGINAVSNPNSYQTSVSPQATQTYYLHSTCGTDSVTVQPFPAFSLTAWGDTTICRNAFAPLSASSSDSAGWSLKWNPTQGLINPVTGGTDSTSEIVLAAPAISTHYIATATNINGCLAHDTVLITVQNSGAELKIVAEPEVLCQSGGTVQLTLLQVAKSCGANNTLCTGNSIPVQVGTGNYQTPAGSATGYPTVYGHYQKGARHQFLYKAAELKQYGVKGGTIKSIAFYLSQSNSSANDSLENFEIKMGCVSLSNLENGWVSNLQTVFTPKSLTLWPPANTGWKTHLLDIPYDWDGVSDIVVEVCSYTGNSGSLNSKMMATNTPFVSVCYTATNIQPCDYFTPYNTSSTRPNTLFNVCVQDLPPGTLIHWLPDTGTNAALPTAGDLIAISNPVSPTTYTATAYTPNGCTSNAIQFVNVNTTNAISINFKDTFLCQISPVVVQPIVLNNSLIDNTITYQCLYLTTGSMVFSGAGSFTLPQPQPGKYLLKTTSTPCEARDTFEIVNPVAAQLSVSFAAAPIKCHGNKTTLKANITGSIPGGYTLLWNTGHTTDSITNVSSGTYSLTISNASGCSYTYHTTITQPAAIAFIFDSIKHPLTATSADGIISVIALDGIAPYSYSWSNAAQVPAIGALGPGTYSLTVTDAHGCSATTSVTLTALTNAVNNVNLHDLISVVPNPFRDEIFIRNIPVSSITHVTITDPLGRVLFYSPIMEETMTITTSEWGTGIYFLNIRTDYDTYSQFVIKH